MLKLIGVTGYRRCGKDSTCNVLVDHFGFKKYGFADALRRMALAINPIISLHGAPENVSIMLAGNIGQLHSKHKTEYRYNELIDELSYERAKDIPDFRHFLQKLGTEGVRQHFGPKAWVDALAFRLEADAPELVCISDVRFRSEADWILSEHGVIIRVNRPGVGGDDPHPSEVEIPSLPADSDITASSLDELRQLVISTAISFGCVPVPPTVQVSHGHTSTHTPSTHTTHHPASTPVSKIPGTSRGS